MAASAQTGHSDQLMPKLPRSIANKKTTVCQHCKRSVPFKGPYHSGFSNQGFLYCNRDSTVLVFDTYSSHYGRIIPNKHPWILNAKEKQLLESHLNACPCGGTFGFRNKPRCPHCGKEIKNLTDSIYYIVVNKVVNGNKSAAWNSGHNT